MKSNVKKLITSLLFLATIVAFVTTFSVSNDSLAASPQEEDSTWELVPPK